MSRHTIAAAYLFTAAGVCIGLSRDLGFWWMLPCWSTIGWAGWSELKKAEDERR